MHSLSPFCLTSQASSTYILLGHRHGIYVMTETTLFFAFTSVGFPITTSIWSYCHKDITMSRHSSLSKHKRGHSSSSNSTTEDYIAQSKSIVDLLNEVVTERPYEWETYLASARSAMNALDHVRFFRETNRFVEQVWLLDSLQDYAFHDPDNGYIQDIAVWCESSWLRLLRTFPENTQILTGGCPTPACDTSESDRRLILLLCQDLI